MRFLLIHAAVSVLPNGSRLSGGAELERKGNLLRRDTGRPSEAITDERRQLQALVRRLLRAGVPSGREPTVGLRRSAARSRSGQPRSETRAEVRTELSKQLRSRRIYRKETTHKR